MNIKKTSGKFVNTNLNPFLLTANNKNRPTLIPSNVPPKRVWVVQEYLGVKAGHDGKH